MRPWKRGLSMFVGFASGAELKEFIAWGCVDE